MELVFENNQELVSGTYPSVTHFPDDVCRVFFVDPANNNMIYQIKTSPDLGVWTCRTFTEKKIAYPVENIQYFSTYYTPHKFLVASVVSDNGISLLVYNEQVEIFQAFQTLDWDWDYQIPKPEANVFLHTQAEQQKFVKIEVLDDNENPFATIESEAIDGNITIDSESSVRRVCDLKLVLTEDLLPNINKIIWLDRKFRVKIGIKDLMTDEIIYYDFGIFVISNPSIDIQIGEKSINIKGYDKACFLNGDISGQLENVIKIGTKIPLYVAIQLVISTLGGESKVFIDADSCFLNGMTNVPFFNTLKDLKTYETYYGFKGDLVVKKNGATITTGFTVNYVDFTIVFDSALLETDVITVDGDMVYTIPYEIEKSTDNTVWDLVDDITKLYMSFQSYYDVNGYFIFNKTKNMLNEPHIWDFSQYDVRISCTNNIMFDNIRNYYKVLGAVLEDLTQIQAEEEITDVDNPFSTANIKRRPLVISEDSYFTVEACQERLAYEKFKHTNFNEQISVECIPLYFLDVNTLIKIDKPEEGISGVYCITNLNVPLKYDGTMSFQAYKVY